MHLREPANVEYLMLDGTGITEKGWAQLQNMPKLSEIGLEDTKIPEKARHAFLLYLPAHKDQWHDIR